MSQGVFRLIIQYHHGSVESRDFEPPDWRIVKDGGQFLIWGWTSGWDRSDLQLARNRLRSDWLRYADDKSLRRYADYYVWQRDV